MNEAQRAAILLRLAEYRDEHPKEAARLDALFAPVRAEMDRLRLQMARVEFVVALEELLARRAGEVKVARARAQEAGGPKRHVGYLR